MLILGEVMQYDPDFLSRKFGLIGKDRELIERALIRIYNSSAGEILIINCLFWVLDLNTFQRK